MVTWTSRPGCEYARALLLAAQTDTSDEAIGTLVAARMARRAIFDKPDPAGVVVVLDEAVLHRLIGSAQVMYDQLTQVAEFSVRPYICVQVVPAGNGAKAGLGGALNIAGGGGHAQDVIAVRDTGQDQVGPVLRFSPAAWRRFAEQLKRS